MADALSSFSTRATPQSKKADPRQMKNHAGGHVFQVTDQTRLNRFLTLGVESGTFYVGAKDLAKENAQFVVKLVDKDPEMLLRTIEEFSVSGRAPKQNPVLFALAATVGVGDDATKVKAYELFPKVLRTGTQRKMFLRYLQQFRGLGRGPKRALGALYGDEIERVAFQMLKYRNREGFTEQRMLQLLHPNPASDAHRALFRWVLGYDKGYTGGGIPVVEGFIKAKTAAMKDIPGLITDYGLTWEMLPDAALNEPATWEALIAKGMPQTALMRQLPRLTRLGLLSPLGRGETTKTVIAQLTDQARLVKARVHPMSVLIALRTYASGHSDRGSSVWTPVSQISDALNDAFYLAFDAVEATGKNFLLALDVSGSMSTSVLGTASLSCREAATAMALITAKTEKNHEIVGFTSGMKHVFAGGGRGWRGNDGLSRLDISPRMRLDEAVRKTARLPFGGTDCALPVQYALANKLHVDTFCVYTDNETWAGSVHPFQVLKQYRNEVNPNARMVVLGMAANDFTIADPSDAGSMDIAGFDAAVPQLITSFTNGIL